jgi:hypothetical protein
MTAPAHSKRVTRVENREPVGEPLTFARASQAGNYPFHPFATRKLRHLRRVSATNPTGQLGTLGLSYAALASEVARAIEHLRDAKVAGSNPVAPTITTRLPSASARRGPARGSSAVLPGKWSPHRDREHRLPAGHGAGGHPEHDVQAGEGQLGANSMPMLSPSGMARMLPSSSKGDEASRNAMLIAGFG